MINERRKGKTDSPLAVARKVNFSVIYDIRCIHANSLGCRFCYAKLVVSGAPAPYNITCGVEAEFYLLYIHVVIIKITQGQQIIVIL